MTSQKNTGGYLVGSQILAPVTETFGLSRTLAITTILLVLAVLSFAIFWFFHSAPPKTITITSGPEGSSFMTNAILYRDYLKLNHVTLKIIPSQGSEENLERLTDPKLRVDIGFVQGGVTNGLATSRLVSLGSINYEPLLVFYRGSASVGMLSEFSGKRLAIGPIGSGTRRLALSLLQMNGIETNGTTTLLDLDSEDAAQALLRGSVDAVFLMGDSASTQVMRELLHAPGIHLMDFTQAEAYTRRISFLNNLEFPMGAIDFGKNLPAHDLHLIGPTVELIARPDLHPALSDLLLEAAQHVNGSASIMRRKGEFPAPLQHDFPLSADAVRFYKSGKKFWLVSLVSRILVAFGPLALVVIPGLKLIPALYKWRIRLVFYRRYRALLGVERDLLAQLPSPNPEKLIARLNQIEQAVDKMKVPASFADQFYTLRQSIQFVRGRLIANTPGK